jgi:hypothetical protein
VSSTAPISCGSDKVSAPGATSLSQCEASQISVNFQINNVDPGLSQSQFQAALPSNLVVDSYVDVIVSAQGSCPTGYYCPVDTTIPFPCPAGTYNNLTGQNDAADCLVCPVGQYCPIISTLPADCAAGSYRITEGAQQQENCTVCPSGNYCPVRSVTPTNCSAGTYNPTTGGGAVSDCLACLAGNFCPIATTTPTQCAAGSYRGSVGGVDQGSCAACISGNYCPLGSVDPTNCTAGTFRASTGASASTNCLPCPAGQYCVQATTTPANCDAGSYRGSVGGVAQTSCTTCPSGNYCPSGSVDPTNCTAGKYNMLTGQASAAACLPCPAGGYCPVATSTPLQCAANTFTATTGAAVCDECPVFSTSPVASTNCTCNAGHYHVVTITGGGASTQSFVLTRMDPIYNNVIFNSKKFLQSDGSSHIFVTKGCTVTLSSQAYGSSSVTVPLKVYSDLYDTLPYFISKSDIDPNRLGFQTHDLVPKSSSMTNQSQGNMIYSVGVTGSGSNILSWDTTDVPSNLYFVGTSLLSNDVPISLFAASVTPTTITYTPSSTKNTALFMTAACLGDTLILHKPTGLSRYTTLPLKDLFVSCVQINENSLDAPYKVLASGPSPLTWVVAGVDDTNQCYVSYGPPEDGHYSLITIYPRPRQIGPEKSTLTCTNWCSGYRSNPGAQACSECGLGYYSNPVSQTCTVCPAGTKCPTTTSPAPVDCGVGFYQPQSSASCPLRKPCVNLAKSGLRKVYAHGLSKPHQRKPCVNLA